LGNSTNTDLLSEYFSKKELQALNDLLNDRKYQVVGKRAERTLDNIEKFMQASEETYRSGLTFK
jgi:hypothetical protein